MEDGRAVRISRRKLLRKAPIAAATALGASALLEAPASATDGSAITAGNVTLAEHRTSVRYDGTSGFGGIVLLGNDSTYDGITANFPAALGGFAGAGGTAGSGGVANGVYGYTDNGSGNGVVGVNNNFVPGAGAGVLGKAFGSSSAGVVGTNTQGTAVSGSSDSTASNATAVLGVITSTSPGGYSAAVRGQNNGTLGGGVGVYGSQNGAGWGVYGTSVSGAGVVGFSSSGPGVSADGGNGINASGTTGVGGYFTGPQAPIHLTPSNSPGAPTTGTHSKGDVWIDGLGVQWICTLAGTPGTFLPVQAGGLNQALFTAVSTSQYAQSNSDGSTWVDVDAVALKLTITAAFNSQAIISGNADLWTSTAGFNQDLGIFISGGVYGAGQLVAWKESGGFAGTFSPNAAFVETVEPFAAGTTYTVRLQWKANKPGSSTIWIGAGSSPRFSPTRLTAYLVVS